MDKDTVNIPDDKILGETVGMRRLLVLSALASLSAFSFAQSFGPTPYLQTSDSPFLALGVSNFNLEDFEDNLFNITGVTKDNGNPYTNGSNGDSVDGDDGAVDGSGLKGHSLFSSGGSAGVTFTFSQAVLGTLPTYAGVVWTDGAGTITFEAWDQNGVSLGTLVGNHADGSFAGQTAEDRFYGWHNAGGISKIKLKNASGGIELDHLQYGYESVPEPATMGLLGLGALALSRRKKS